MKLKFLRRKEMNKKALNLVIIFSVIIAVCIGTYSFALKCWCYDEVDAAEQCAFSYEYMFSVMIGGKCIGPGCDGTVKVTCWDFDHGGKYVRSYNSWDPNCTDCYR